MQGNIGSTKLAFRHVPLYSRIVRFKTPGRLIFWHLRELLRHSRLFALSTLPLVDVAPRESPPLNRRNGTAPFADRN